MTNECPKKAEEQKVQEALIRLCCLSGKQMRWPPFAKVDDLIRNGASFTCLNKIGLMPIEQAAIAGNEAMLSVFVARGGLVSSYPSLLYYSVLYGHDNLSHALYCRMSIKAKWGAFYRAFQAGKARQYCRNLSMFCAKKRRENKKNHIVIPPFQAQLKECVAAFCSKNVMRRQQYRFLLQTKKEMRKCLAAGCGETLVPLFLRAVYQENPLVIDYLYAYGDVFLVSEKAFAQVAQSDETRFTEKWLQVTDEVASLRQYRQQEYLRHRAAHQKSHFRRLIRRMARFLNQPLYTQTKTVRIKKIKQSLSQKETTAVLTKAKTCERSLTKQHVLNTAVIRDRCSKNE